MALVWDGFSAYQDTSTGRYYGPDDVTSDAFGSPKLRSGASAIPNYDPYAYAMMMGPAMPAAPVAPLSISPDAAASMAQMGPFPAFPAFAADTQVMGPPAPPQVMGPTMAELEAGRASESSKVSPEVKSAVDTLLGLWDSGSGSSGSHQGVIRHTSSLMPNNPVGSIPSRTSGASDADRLKYAMAILEAGKVAQGAFSSKGLNAWKSATSPLMSAYEPAGRLRWQSTSPDGPAYGQWAQYANQLGFNGPIYGEPYDTPDGGVARGYSPEFVKFVDQARAQGYDFVQDADNAVNFNQRYGFRLPSGEVVGQTSIRGDQDVRDFGMSLLPIASMMLGLPGVGGALAQSIGSTILPASAAASIGSAIGASASAVTSAVGQAAIQSGLSALGGGDAQDVIRAGVTGLVSQAVPSVIKDVIPPSLGPLESVAEKALASAAMSGISGKGDPASAALGSLAGSAAGAIPGAGSLPPGVVQGALELASTGKVSLGTAINAAINAAQTYEEKERQQTQQQIDKAYSDPSRKLDVPQPPTDIQAELDSILGGPSDVGALVAGPMDFAAPDRTAQKSQLADFIRQQAASGAPGFRVGRGGVLEVEDVDNGLVHQFTSDGSALGSSMAVFESASGRPLATPSAVKDFLAAPYVRSLFEGGAGEGAGAGRYLVPEVSGEGVGSTEAGTNYTPEQAAQWDREAEEERAAEELLQVNPPVTLPVDEPSTIEPIPPYQPELPPTGVDTSGDYGQSVFEEIDRVLAEQARQRQEEEFQRQEEERQQFEAQRQQEVLREQERQDQEAARQAEERRQAEEVRRQQEEQQTLAEQARLEEQQALEYQRQEAEREYERLAEREAQEAAIRAQQEQVTPEAIQPPPSVVPEPAEPQLPSVPQDLVPEPPVVLPEEPYQPEAVPAEPVAPPSGVVPEEPPAVEPPPVAPPVFPPVQEPVAPPFEPPAELPFEPLPETPVEPSVPPVEPPAVQPPVQQPSGLDLDEVRQIVSEALLINPSLTEQQVRDIVSEVMGTLPPGLTPQDVAQVVDSAIGRLPQGPTTADLDAIRGAVGGVEAGLTGQIGGLRQEVQEQYDMLSAAQQAEVARRVQQGEDLNRAIADVQAGLAGAIGEVEAGLTGQIGGLRQEVQQQYSALSAAQQAEVERRVQQGADLTQAISDVQSGLEGTIAGVEEALAGQIGGLRQELSEQYQMLSDAQQAEVQRRINQGENLEAAINAVSSGLGERLSGVETGLTQKIGGVEERLNDRIDELVNQGVDFQTATNQALQEVTGGLGTLAQQQAEQAQTTQQAIGGVETRLNDRIDQLMRQGVDWQTATEQAISELSGTVSGIAEQTQSSISGLGLDIQSQIEEMQRQQELADAAAAVRAAQLQEQNRLATEAAVSQAVQQAAQEAERQRAAQAAQAAEASRRQGLLGLASSFAAQGASQASASDPYKATFLKPYIVGGTAPEKFEGPLSGFLKQAMTGDFLPDKPQEQPRQSEDQEMGADQFFSGANPLDMYQPEQEYQGLFGFRAGGVVPFMAQGGTRYGHNAHGALRVLEHSGKHRVDYRQGDAVTGIGDGQSDDIPAMLADGEFVIPADVVAALGNGSTKAGSDKLYEMMHNIRRHHRSTGPKDLPPPAKAPLEYIKSRKGRSA